MLDLNLIHLFDFYLAVAFLFSTVLRVRQYRDILSLVRAVPGRWPRLFQLVRQHSTIFLTWTTVLPAVLALGLSTLHMLACRLVWPQATVTLGEVTPHGILVATIAILAMIMLAVDGYATWNYGAIDREMLCKYFDQAEYWLGSWTAPVVRVFTLGYVNPRRMVAAEVRSALVEASRVLNSTFWWVSVQTSLRIAFGLILWITFALST